MQDSNITGAGGTGLEGLRLGPRDRVLVLGGYGVRNTGDEAILAGLLTQLPSGARVRVISRSPRETKALHQVSAVSPARALLALMRTDALIIGGGGLFSGHMGPMGRLIPLFSRIALARGTRVAFHGVGVYPSTPPPVQRALASLAPRLASFTVRDRASVRMLESMGIPARRIPDLSTFMPERPPTVGSAMLGELKLDERRPTVGLCMTATEPRMDEFVETAIPVLADHLPDIQFLFIPMSHHPTVASHNDLLLARKLNTLNSRIAVLESFRHPADILALFRHLGATVCMRYHSLLFAQRAGIPFVPVAYAEKCEDWMAEQGTAPVELTRDGLVRAVSAALAAGKGTGRVKHRFAISTAP